MSQIEKPGMNWCRERQTLLGICFRRRQKKEKKLGLCFGKSSETGSPSLLQGMTLGTCL